ncbi:MAG: hypothetical protein ACRD2O_14565 [Terriglobia bacterium]
MQLLRDILQACRSEFAENARINAALDDKAQKTGALAGIFLAAGFAFLKPENVTLLNNSGRWQSLAPLAVAVLMLMICVVICLTVMWVRTMPATPAVESLMRSAESLLALPSGELTSQRLENDLRETIKIWQVSLESWLATVNSKGHWLNVGQTCLVIAMGSITYLLVYVLYRGVWR